MNRWGRMAAEDGRRPLRDMENGGCLLGASR